MPMRTKKMNKFSSFDDFWYIDLTEAEYFSKRKEKFCSPLSRSSINEFNWEINFKNEWDGNPLKNVFSSEKIVSITEKIEKSAK